MGASSSRASLLPYRCPLPGCHDGVTSDPAVPCEGCLSDFGPLLRPGRTPSPRRSPEEAQRLLAERDAAVRAAYAAQRTAPHGGERA